MWSGDSGIFRRAAWCLDVTASRLPSTLSATLYIFVSLLRCTLHEHKHVVDCSEKEVIMSSNAVPRPRKRPAPSAFLARKPPLKKAALSAAGTPSQRADTPSQPPYGSAASTTEKTQHDRPPDQVFDVYISKSDLEQGMRFHGFKFDVKRDNEKAPTQIIDPWNASEFTRPVHLHRRYAHDKQDNGDQSDAPSGIDDKEREAFNAKKAERQAEREANQANIAPTSGAAKRAPRKKNEKNVMDVYYDENNPKQQKAAQLRYEETKPWHLEDFDNKNTWIGSYQEPLSEQSVLLTLPETADGPFTMVPVERWYKFTETGRLPSMSTEQAERIMASKIKPSRWFMGTQVGQQEAKKAAVQMLKEKAAAARRAAEDDTAAVPRVKDEGDFYNADVDVLDMEFADEEFQDDDEGALVVGEDDADTREIERRIREEMRGANISAPGLKDQAADYDQEEEQQKEQGKEQKRRERRMKKRLIKKEKQYHYESDSDSDPYNDSSEETDSEEERERADEEKKAEEEALKLTQGGDPSGASSKGTNTPSGRPEKKDDVRLTSLKRPGSPNLSDVSGNESRKKQRVANDETRRIRLKNSPPGSPRNDDTPSGSRAQSPAPVAMPSLDEVRAAIPPEGIAIKDLTLKFRARVQGKENTTAFIKLVSQAGQRDSTSKLIVPKAGEQEGTKEV
nr:hypothetical protein B0A51_10759 [Rachicladosporium sp. CCFEE 5018]